MFSLVILYSATNTGFYCLAVTLVEVNSKAMSRQDRVTYVRNVTTVQCYSMFFASTQLHWATAPSPTRSSWKNDLVSLFLKYSICEMGILTLFLEKQWLSYLLRTTKSSHFRRNCASGNVGPSFCSFPKLHWNNRKGNFLKQETWKDKYNRR